MNSLTETRTLTRKIAAGAALLALVPLSGACGAQLPSSDEIHLSKVEIDTSSLGRIQLGEVKNAAAPSIVTSKALSGYAFDHPRDWRIDEDPSGAVKVVPNGAAANEAYILGTTSSQGIAKADDPRCATIAEQEMRQLLPGLHRNGAVERFRTGVGPAMLLDMSGTNNTGAPLFTEIYVTIDRGTAIAFVAIAPERTIEARRKALLTLFGSLRVDNTVPAGYSGTPLVREWIQRLQGKRLTKLSGYSSGSSGGMNSRADLLLMAGGRFSYHSSSSVSIYVPGATGGSASQKDLSGTWRIVELQGSAWLELRPNGSPFERIRLENRSGKTFLNNVRWFVTD